MTNALYYGDNLRVLRENIKDESVDLIYLDPPFNSNATFNVLFSSPKGHKSDAQIEAFEDTWHWGPQAEQEYAEILHSPNTDVAEMMEAMRSFLGENDVMAYLTMMANRLVELHRVLKPTGSLYLHCDPTASHYLKLVLDGVFGKENYINEVIWKRYGAHNDVGQGSKHFGRTHDTLFYYARNRDAQTWRQLFTPLDEQYIRTTYRSKDEHGVFMTTPLTGPGGAEKGNPVYEWHGHTRAWRYGKETMQRLHDEGRLYYSKTGYARQKFYLAESSGVPIQDVWNDIPSLSGAHKERLGYPTQKPLALLKRIIEASSNPGDLVLDPFCGCGTAVHAAQKLRRSWVGIDITSLAIGLIEKRLRDAFPGIALDVFGTPTDVEGARDLAIRDKYQFQWWACTLVDAQPYQGKKKGADTGIDGLIFFEDEKDKAAKRVLVSVKAGENVGVAMVKDLIATVSREKAAIGLFVTLAQPTKPMIAEGASAGFYESPLGISFPRIQILPVADLMSGKVHAAYPFYQAGSVTFKRAKVEIRDTKQERLFDAPLALSALPIEALGDDPAVSD